MENVLTYEGISQTKAKEVLVWIHLSMQSMNKGGRGEKRHKNKRRVYNFVMDFVVFVPCSRPLIVIGGASDTDQEEMGAFQELPQVASMPCHAEKRTSFRWFLSHS